MDPYVCGICGKEFDAYWACVGHVSRCSGFAPLPREKVESIITPLSEDYKEFLLTIVQSSPEYIEHYERRGE